MTEELKKSIESLYSTFSIYPFRSTIDGCLCCVSQTDKEILIKIKATAVNSTDWHLRKANPFMVRFFFDIFKPKKNIQLIKSPLDYL